MKTPRIILFDQYPFLGGGQIVLLSVVHAALGLNHPVVVMAPGGGPLEKTIAQRFGGQVSFVAIPEPKLTHGAKRFADYLQLLWYAFGFFWTVGSQIAAGDIVYVNGPRLFLPSLLLSLFRGRGYLYHLHLNTSAVEKALVVLASRAKRTIAIIAISSFVAGKLKVFGGSCLRQDRIMQVDNALGDRYRELSFVDRFQKSGRLQIVVVGVLRRDKGQDQAVELARRLPEIDVHLVGRIGPGAEVWVEQLKGQATVNVTFHAPVEDVAAFIAGVGAHIALVPSRWEEPFGLVAIEGMACSCIGVLRDRGGLGEIARRTGAFLYDGSDDQLESILRSLLAQDQSVLTNLARRQYEACQRLYAPDLFRQKIERILRAALV